MGLFYNETRGLPLMTEAARMKQPAPLPCLTPLLKTTLCFCFFSLALSLVAVPTAFAHSPESDLCISATQQVERGQHIPEGFLSAMSRVESGKIDTDGSILAWPWTVNAAGIGHHYASKTEAIEAVGLFRQQGIVSIDVGCMQVNLQQHPDAFANLEMAFDPVRNAYYAGQFLLQLYTKTGSWPHAAAAYHSQTPGIGTPYQWKVLEAWATPQDGRQDASGLNAHAPFGQTSQLHTVIPQVRHPPILVASPSNPDGTTPSGSPHIFHPFEGGRHFTEPTPTRRMNSNVRGRSLASYRASPIARANALNSIAPTLD